MHRSSWFARAGRQGVLAAVALWGLSSLAPATPVIQNPSFEADPLPAAPGYGAISDWTGGSGLNGSGGPFHGGLIPDGNQVAFIQHTGKLTQTVDGFEAGKKYILTYFESGRPNNLPTGQASIGGTVLIPEHDVTPIGTDLLYHFKSVTFDSPGTGAYDLVLEQPDDKGGDNTICYDMVNIVEVGGPAGILSSYKAYDFGPATIAQNVDATITLFNNGGSALNVSSLALSGANKAEFSVVSPAGAFSLDPDTSKTVQVRFTPASAGDKASTLTVNSNDPKTPALAIGLTGSGAGEVAVLNPSFEVDPNPPYPGNVGAVVTGWKITSGCGFQSSDAYSAGLTFYDNGLCPDGTKVAVIQGSGSFTQSIPGFVKGNLYEVSVWVNQRTGNSNPAQFQCKLGSLTLFNSNPPLNVSPAEALGSFTKPFQHFTEKIVSPVTGNMDFVIANVNPQGDNTLLFDNATITPSVNSSQYWSVFK